MEVKDIVTIYENEPRVGTWILAKGFGKEHKPTVRTIENNKESFTDFGVLKTLKCRSTGGRPVVEYMLNEGQALLLVTMYRNNPQVIKFKKKLIKEFIRMKNLIRRVKEQQDDPVWAEVRQNGKILRLESTDTMKAFIEYAAFQGSTHSKRYYTNLTRMVNGALFITEGKFLNLRNVMTSRQLMIIGASDGIIDKALSDGMKRKMFYKDIYIMAKNRIFQFADLHGQMHIIAKQLRIGDKLSA